MSPVRILLYSALAVFLASGAGLVLLVRGRGGEGRGGPGGAGAAEGVAGLSIPAFSLVDQDGRPVRREDLLGRVTVLDAVFTRCVLACPMMTERMNDLARSLAGVPGVQFVSISVDPGHDTPERLRAFMAEHGVRDERWRMLTDPGGSDAAARAVFEKGLLCAVEPDESVPGRFNIIHPTYFFLIDGRGGDEPRVVGLYQSARDEDMQRLRAEVRGLAGK